ncbi:response regulator [Paenibacillus sp. TRM 82003]|nr:response regulator [Paenibacillus sp. TRM 82003]
MKILLVDDESLVRTSMARLIANMKPEYALKEAEDGEEALKLLEQEAFDLLITDIRMPAVNGLELARRVRERWPELTIVMLTGHADFQYAQEAIRYNVKEYLLKPVSVEHLRRMIETVEATVRTRRASEEVGKLRRLSLLEKRVHDLFYELPLPYYDESLFPPFDRFALYSFSISSEQDQSRTARFAVKNVVEDVLSPHGTTVVVVGDRAVTAVLFVPPAAGGCEAPALDALAETVPPVAKQVVKLDVKAAVGGASSQLNDIRKLYRDSLRGLGTEADGDSEPESGEASESPPEQVHRIVRGALEMIQERFQEDLSLTSIAEAMFVSPNYLSSLFKTETGSTFTHHLTKARMNRAKTLLRETNMKIYQICERVGYADQAHFSRMFKTLEGMSPYEYRTKGNI